jgi:hypothetical protein
MKSMRRIDNRRRRGGDSFLKLQFDALVESFRKIGSRKFALAALFDLMTVLAILIMMNLCMMIINAASAQALPTLLQIHSLQQSGDTAGVHELAVTLVPILDKIIWISIATAVTGFILTTFLISWFYGKAWAIGNEQRFTLRYLSKGFLVNAMWFIVWGALLIATALAFVPEAAIVLLTIELFILLYSDPVLRSLFDEPKKIRQVFKEYFKTMIRVHWFMVYIIAFFIVLLPFLLLIGTAAAIPWLGIVLLVLSATFMAGWSRNYIISIVSRMRR